jgi:hypothetical protein
VVVLAEASVAIVLAFGAGRRHRHPHAGDVVDVANLVEALAVALRAGQRLRLGRICATGEWLPLLDGGAVLAFEVAGDVVGLDAVGDLDLGP